MFSLLSNLSLEEIGTIIGSVIVSAGTVFLAIKKKINTNKGKLLHTTMNPSTQVTEEISDLVKKILSEIISFRRATLDLLPYPVYEATQAGECTWINIAYSDKLSISRDQALGYGWIEVVHPDDREIVRAEWERCIRDKRVFSFSYRMKNRTTDAIFNVNSRAIPVLTASNEIRCYLGIINLAYVEDKKVAAFITATADGTITSCNYGVNLLLGWNIEDLVGKNIDLLIPLRFINAHRSAMIIANNKLNSESYTKTVRQAFALTKDGREVPISIELISSVVNNNKIFSATISRR